MPPTPIKPTMRSESPTTVPSVSDPLGESRSASTKVRLSARAYIAETRLTSRARARRTSARGLTECPADGRAAVRVPRFSGETGGPRSVVCGITLAQGAGHERWQPFLVQGVEAGASRESVAELGRRVVEPRALRDARVRARARLLPFG